MSRDDAQTLEPGLDLAELVARTEGLQPWRRLFHAASGIVLALGPEALGLHRWAVVGILAGILTLMVAFDVVRLRWGWLNALFFRLFSSLASPREAAHFASSTWYALGGLLVWALVPDHAVPALLVLALADPAASVVGRIWGRHRLGKGSRRGALAFFSVAAVVLWATVGGVAALLTAAVVTAVELLPLRLDDNLTVPLATAVLLLLLVG